MKKTNSYLMFLLMLLFIGLPAMAQEAEEEAVVEEAVVEEEEAIIEEAAEEAVVEEAVFEEEFVELEFEEESAGIKIGVGAGFTVLRGAYVADATSAPSIDIFVRIPYTLYLGGLEVSVGAELQTFDFSSGGGPDISGIGLMGVANFNIVETPAGAVYAHIGAGYLGSSLGITAGAKFDYPIPNVMEGKLSATAFLKANATLDGGIEVADTPSEGENSTTGWANFGIALNYAL